MKNSKTYFFLFFIFIIIGILISEINFIPTWENIQDIIIFICFLISSIIVLLLLFKTLKNKVKLNIIGWFKKILIFVSLIGILIISFLYSILTAGKGFFGPVFEKEYRYKKIVAYQYVYSCFPPDNGCECNNYYTLVYIKDSYLPIIHLKTKVDFYIDTIQFNENNMLINASGKCERDKNKSIIVSLK